MTRSMTRSMKPNWLKNLLVLAINDHGFTYKSAAHRIGITENALYKSLKRLSAGIGVHTLARYARRLGYNMTITFRSKEILEKESPEDLDVE